MKYTKLFNNHDEYVAYTGSTAFIRPNVSYCIQEDEPHCTPQHFCQEVHIYELMGEPSYPSSVPASATSFDLSFSYTDTYTSTTCDQGSFMDGDTVTIPIEENPSMSARTITGTYIFHDISIPYSFTQEGREELPYNQQYLTFEILTGGTILWKAATTSVTRTISYSVNNGEWTEITSTTDGVEINVSAGDKVLLKGVNEQYATAKDTGSVFSGGTAYYNVEGNIMSLIGGDNFSGLTSFNNKSWVFHNLFAHSNAVSAKNLILPVTELTPHCYRAMFSKANNLTEAPVLPATTLTDSCYKYMFDVTLLTEAPELPAETLVANCYEGMFQNCNNLNYVKCMATDISASYCANLWLQNVASVGVFVKNSSMKNWGRGSSGIPTNWVVYNDSSVEVPVISFNGFETITLSCETEGADILYKLNDTGEYSAYTTPIIINEDTFIEAYATYSGETSRPISQTCQYVSIVPIEYSNRDLKKWQYGGQEITTPYSINAIDGHSSNYAKGTFTFETSFALKEAEPTYLWFQHADQSASIYVDDTLVEKHWGGYAAFTSDISEYVHGGINNIKVAIKNNEGNNLAPASADFNFNATLGNVRLLTSPYVPAMEYGYDGFHITSTVSDAEATMNIKTSVPSGATLVCKIDDGNTNIYSATSASTGAEMTFTKVIANPHLWNGKSDPYLYTVTLEIYEGNDLYHRFVRPYGLRYYEYVINDTEKVGTVSEPYTGFLLNGHKYLLRGCCMHDDIAGKANALNESDYDTTFATIQDLGLNFLRLAHYPHPKEVYDRCDALGIIVQTEAPCVNNLKSTMPTAYYEHLIGQYTDMVNQHYNHPCIVFWGLSNETTTDSTSFGKQKVEEYTALIKSLDTERLVGYVLAQGQNSNPSLYYGDPQGVDWFGCNMYVGWYTSTGTNNPSSELQTRLNNTVARIGKPIAYSEYGGGGTSTCHTDRFESTTTRGNNPRHDIECLMWIHEGHIAAIKNFPQLISTSQWQLFDIAVASRNEGFTECLDGDNASINDNLRHLNDKGLVERDHVTRKDPFYLYKAWWNPTPFVHICQKNFTRRVGRTIKCYSNDGDTFKLYVNGTLVDTATATDNIVLFAPRTFNNGDVIKVSGSTSTDEFTMPTSPLYNIVLTTKYNVTDTVNPTTIGGSGYVLSFEEIEIDGVKQQDVVSAYTFSTTGEHTVKYKLDNTSIDYYALNGCSNITDIEIPNGVTMLKDGCFKECTSLSSVTIPNSVTFIDNSVFKGCSSLLNVTIPDSVTSIGEGVFSGCTNLESVSIGSGITAFSANNLDDCHNILSITVDSNNSVYDSRNNCNAIIKTSNKSLIRGCKNTIIPSDVTTIGDGAFKGCYGLTSIDIPNSVTSIGTSAFNNCRSLTSIVIPDSVTSIGGYAFQSCTSLINCTIGSGVTSIGGGTFDACSGLTSCTIGSGVTSIGNNAFTSCSGLTSIVIPNSVTSIGNGVFSGCRSLTSIDIPNSVTSIGNGALYYCTSLTSCTISSGVTKIEYSTFYNCSGLTSIVIPGNVTNIGNTAFYNCTNLTSIVCNATTAPTISNTAFRQIKTGGTLTVPIGSTGYDTWMQNANYYLGLYNWTKVEQ